MARKVYSNASISLSSTAVDSSFEVSDFTINITNNTTPDWEPFGEDWAINSPTTATFSCTFNTTLDTVLALDLEHIINTEISCAIYCDSSQVYSGTITLSADAPVSRTDYGKVSWSGKGTLNASENVS